MVNAQTIGIGTNTPNASARLDITATNKGLLIPRVSLTSINDVTTIPSPVLSLLIFNTNAAITGGNGIGFYVWGAGAWYKIALNADTWSINGNDVSPTHFIGTTNTEPIRFKISDNYAGYLSDKRIFIGVGAGENEDTLWTNGYTNIGIGTAALKRNTKGIDNIAIGDSAMYSANDAGTSYLPHRNIAIGKNALKKHARGGLSIAIGYRSQENYNPDYDYSNLSVGAYSLQENNSGSFNTVLGTYAMSFPSDAGDHNTAIGFNAMRSSKESKNCVAIGTNALYINGNSNSSDPDKGQDNTTVGAFSMFTNRDGYANTVVGSRGLFSNTDGYRNTVTGDSVMAANITGHGNIAMGYQAGIANVGGNLNCFLGTSSAAMNTSGDKNVVIGALAYGETNSSTGNTLVGHQAGDNFNLGNNNTLLGFQTDVSANGFDNSTALGYNATITASNQIRIGNVGTSSIGGYQNWSNISDGRYKTTIQRNVPGLEFILKLSPVTYHLDVDGIIKALGKAGNDFNTNEQEASLQKIKTILFSGFIAQDVEKTAKEMGYDFNGVDAPKNPNDFYGLRYAEFVVPLVQAVQEQQLLINNLQKQLTNARSEINFQNGRNEEVLAELKKRIELLEKNK